MAVDLPKEPDIQVQAPTENENPTASYQFKALLIWADYSTQQGYVVLKENTIFLQHQYGQSRLMRSVDLRQVESIQLEAWQPQYPKNENSVFYPVRSEWVLKNGEVLKVLSPPSFLHEFELKSRRGETKVYTYYYDEKQELRWKHSGSSDEKNMFYDPHPQVPLKLVFLND